MRWPKFLLLLILFSFLYWNCEKDFSPLEKDSKTLVRKEMVLFASDRNGGNMNIWMMEKDGSHPRQVTFLPGRRLFSGGYIARWENPALYRWDHYTLVSRIFVMPTTGPQPDSDQFLISYLCRPGNFFPDGRRFVYDQHTIVSDTNSHDAVYIFDLQDSSSILVTPLGSSLEYAAFYSQVSPDGDKISFVQFYFNQFGLSGSQLYLMNLDGSNKQALTPGAQGIRANKGRFSRDGRKLFFTMYDPQRGYDPYFADTNTGQIILILNSVTSSDNPCPDTSGTKVYFRSGGGAEANQISEIAVVNIDGSELKKLTNNQYREDMPVVDVIEFYE